MSPRLALRIWLVCLFWIDDVFKFGTNFVSWSILLGLRGFAAGFAGAPVKDLVLFWFNSNGRNGSIWTLDSWLIVLKNMEFPNNKK